MTRAVTSTITGIIFFFWILPLGAFIRPSDEEKACNGQRAICLCSHLLAKQSAKHAGKTLLKNASSSESPNATPSSHFYVNAQLAAMKAKTTVATNAEFRTFYSNSTREPASPVPKALFS